MKLTKEMILNYLVDVLGYSEEEARKDIAVYTLKELLTPEQWTECKAFNN